MMFPATVYYTFKKYNANCFLKIGPLQLGSHDHNFPTIFVKILCIVGYNLKNARNGKSIIIENTKMAKFEVPSFKE